VVSLNTAVVGEWLGTAVQIAALVSWQAHWALRPLAHLDVHERPIAQQGRSFLELYGAVLVGALAACDTALDKELAADVQVELPAVDSVVETWTRLATSATVSSSRSRRSATRSGSTAPAATATPRSSQPSGTDEVTVMDTNPAPGHETVPGTPVASAGCLVADFTVSTATAGYILGNGTISTNGTTATPVTVAAGTQWTNGTVTVSMNETGADQDSCQNVWPQITVAVG
jgi:hypothetical protein